MKKFFIIGFVLLTFFLTWVYFFIPSKIKFDKITFIKVNITTAKRFLFNEANWVQWWPADISNTKASNSNAETWWYKNNTYTIDQKMYDGINISIKNNLNSINSSVNILPINKDSIAIDWGGEIKNTYNPIKRISNYWLAVHLKENASSLLMNLKSFLENKNNVYGLKIIEEKVKDTILISTKYTSKEFPSIAKTYELVEYLKKYIALNNAVETNYPMLNITQDSAVFKTMVAIPINHRIPQAENVSIKTMVPGKILMTEVTGGNYAIQKARNLLEVYLSENQITSPAIPFESLITNRKKETDSSRWVSKIYYPIY